MRARLTTTAQAWRWSSARAHLAGRDDRLVDAGPLLERVQDWPAFLAEGLDPRTHAAIRSGEQTGRPLGDAGFVSALERDLGRTLARGRPGRKPKVVDSAASPSR